MFSNQSRDFYQRRFPEAPVKINGKVDTYELQARADDPNKAKYLFSGAALTGDLSAAHLKLPDMGFAYVMRDGLATQKGRTSFLDQETAVPINFALNGLGENPHDIMGKIEPVGVIEMGNEDTSDTRVNVLRGGGIDIGYNCPRPSRINAFLQLSCPSKEDAAAMKSLHVAQAQGKDGLVGLMVSEFDPNTMDYLSPEGITHYLTAPSAGAEDPRNPVMKAAVMNMLDDMAEIFHILGKKTLTPTGRSQVEKTTFAVPKDSLHDIMLSMVDQRFRDKDAKSLVNAWNRMIQHMGAVKLDREKWVLFQGQQCGTNGAILPVSCINYGM